MAVLSACGLTQMQENPRSLVLNFWFWMELWPVGGARKKKPKMKAKLTSRGREKGERKAYGQQLRRQPRPRPRQYATLIRREGRWNSSVALPLPLAATLACPQSHHPRRASYRHPTQPQLLPRASRLKYFAGTYGAMAAVRPPRFSSHRQSGLFHDACRYHHSLLR